MTNKEGNTPGPHDGTAADTVAYLAEQRGLALAENAHLRTVNAALVAALRELAGWFALKPGAMTAAELLDPGCPGDLAAAISRARAALAAAEGRTP